jgi:23S rRNA (cytidine1920-2'-O)/16S rRNA (cytidine1409-2'-O)-methyltransferase
MVRRGITSSRTEAQRLIDSGNVLVAGRPSARSATLVSPEEPIEVAAAPRWASRAGGKLEAALDAFGIEVDGLRALDVGASTGGFTDVLLERGAASVVALDVGYGQLLWRLRTDPRVDVRDRTNFRTVDPSELDPPFDLVVVDVSFISIGLLVGNLAAVGGPGCEYVILVKPQFEAGRGAVAPGGVVTDREVRLGAVAKALDALADQALAPMGLIASPVTGSAGNQEYLVHCRIGGAAVATDALLGRLHS